MLHTEQFGTSGRPLVILHGLFGSGSNWRSIARDLSGDYSVYTMDLRNHGKSFWSDSMSYALMAADVNRCITALSLEQPVLIGHSMGGKVAMVLAQQAMLELSLLVVIDIAPIAYEHASEHAVLVKAMMKLPLDSIADRKQADQLLMADIKESSIRQFLLQNLRGGAQGYRWRINLLSIAENIEQIMGYPRREQMFGRGHTPGGSQTGMPPYLGDCVFIRGARSNYVQDTGVAIIQQHFPNAVVETIEDTGHWLHVEQPRLLLQMLRKYIDSG